MIQVNFRSPADESLRLLSRFLTVGVMSTLIDFSLFTLLHGFFAVPTLSANTLSYTAGIVNGFVLHRRWTYAQRVSRTIGARFTLFAVVSLSALLLNNLIVLLLAPPLGVLLADPSLGALVAKASATAVGLCWNFAFNHFSINR